jgi:hypothetical protein
MTMVLGLVAGAAAAGELPPCHPMLGSGAACIMPDLPPPGGEPGPTLLAECGAATLPGEVCRWPAGRVVGFEVVATGWANPYEVLYRYEAVLLLPGPPPDAFDVPVIVENGVVNFQLTLQDSRYCASDGARRRYWESAFVPILAEECPTLLDTVPPPVR